MVTIYRLIIGSVVLYDCETWSVTFRNESVRAQCAEEDIWAPQKKESFRKKVHNEDSIKHQIRGITWYNGNQIRDGKMGWACSMYRREDNDTQGYGEM